MRSAAAVWGLLAVGGAAFGQGLPNGVPVSSGAGGAMSGAAVAPVGQQLPRAVPPAGNPIGNPLTRPNQGMVSINPFGGGIDRNLVVAPTPEYPTVPTSDPGLWDRFKAKLSSVTGMFSKGVPDPPRTTYVPSMSRRNKERADARRFQRD